MSILEEIACFLWPVPPAPQNPTPDQNDIFARWAAMKRADDEAFVDRLIRDAIAKREALYVDPYNEAISLYREYQLGLPA